MACAGSRRASVAAGGRSACHIVAARYHAEWPTPARSLATSLHDLTARVIAFREARGWSRYHGLKDEVLSLLSEAGELADVLYWTLLLAHDVGVDLADALEKNMVENEAMYLVDAARGRADKYTDLCILRMSG